MSDKTELLPCPFCGQQDAFVEQLDSDASVVICQGRIDEHSACLSRGPVAVQESEDEDQPGFDAAIREWNNRAALAQQPAPVAVPNGITLERIERHAQPAGGCPSSAKVVLLSSLKRLFAAAPAAPVAVQMHHEPHNRAMWHTNCPGRRFSSPMHPEGGGAWRCVSCGAIGHDAPPAAEQPDDYRWRAKSGLRYRDWQYGRMAKTAEGREGNPDIEIQALYLHPAAELPDAVMVPRKTAIALLDDGPRHETWLAQDELRALLSGGDKP